MTETPCPPNVPSAFPRPAGVTVLSCLTFLSSALLAFSSFAVMYAIILTVLQSLKNGAEHVNRTVYVLLSMWAIGLAASAWIAFRATVDLRRMRKRGRKLAIASMILLLLLGAFLAWLGAGSDWRMVLTGVGICLVSSVSILYLFLPSVRAKFNKDAASAASALRA